MSKPGITHTPRILQRIEAVARMPMMPHRYWAQKWGMTLGSTSVFLTTHRDEIEARRNELYASPQKDKKPKPKPRPAPPAQSLQEAAAEARAHGMTYGQYVAMQSMQRQGGVCEH